MTEAVDPADEVVRVRVPAKINLSLRVGPVEDGYHRLATVFQAVSLYDDVTARWQREGETTVIIRGREAHLVGTDHTNLAWRAADLLRQRCGGDWGVALTIDKNIPVAGGMAGGSADAAGTLLACAVLWDLDLDPGELRELGAELGADVPFGLAGGTAIGTGRGDVLAPALTRGTSHWVLAMVGRGLSTPEVFRRFDERQPEPPEPEVSPELMAALSSRRPADLAAVLDNDLTEAACDLRPELAELLELAPRVGALRAVLSGSGPTVAFLVADEAAAVDVHLRLKAELGSEVECRRVHGPVPGARLLQTP
ncbi:4-(cytidine 5'-diphospho)-2-C-methyl-D-erythritol kinase [Microlunatus sp. Y2014]|uniref:4-(cytidine 5'-diphospho)-2-C-methyl-D-erythritol kinase n=1 Tax=Microlunatus sp. Y2014 TaxID=3418488 RepID=UPI003DA6D5A9